MIGDKISKCIILELEKWLEDLYFKLNVIIIKLGIIQELKEMQMEQQGLSIIQAEKKLSLILQQSILVHSKQGIKVDKSSILKQLQVLSLYISLLNIDSSMLKAVPTSKGPTLASK